MDWERGVAWTSRQLFHQLAEGAPEPRGD